MIELFSNFAEALVAVLDFTIIMLFRLGLYSVIIWVSILYCGLCMYTEIKYNCHDCPGDDTLCREKGRSKNLKRFKKC